LFLEFWSLTRCEEEQDQRLLLEGLLIAAKQHGQHYADIKLFIFYALIELVGLPAENRDLARVAYANCLDAGDNEQERDLLKRALNQCDASPGGSTESDSTGDTSSSMATHGL
jgi:hypothetical protein